mgnify:CR=1 FL=1
MEFCLPANGPARPLPTPTPPGRPPGDSAAPPFPGAEFAPYSARDYVWNPYGAGLTQQWFGIPIYMLTETLANETGWRADYNAQNDLKVG